MRLASYSDSQVILLLWALRVTVSSVSESPAFRGCHRAGCLPFPPRPWQPLFRVLGASLNTSSPSTLHFPEIRRHFSGFPGVDGVPPLLTVRFSAPQCSGRWAQVHSCSAAVLNGKPGLLVNLTCQSCPISRVPVTPISLCRASMSPFQMSQTYSYYQAHQILIARLCFNQYILPIPCSRWKFITSCFRSSCFRVFLPQSVSPARACLRLTRPST